MSAWSYPYAQTEYNPLMAPQVRSSPPSHRWLSEFSGALGRDPLVGGGGEPADAAHAKLPSGYVVFAFPEAT